jgi:hypothetical protein
LNDVPLLIQSAGLRVGNQIAVRRLYDQGERLVCPHRTGPQMRREALEPALMFLELNGGRGSGVQSREAFLSALRDANNAGP